MFLNHLCGGELTIDVLGCLPTFLNHLCGGELYIIIIDNESVFLNHLCGGELHLTFLSIACTFLNHLCGGEPDYIIKKYVLQQASKWHFVFFTISFLAYCNQLIIYELLKSEKIKGENSFYPLSLV